MFDMVCAYAWGGRAQDDMHRAPSIVPEERYGSTPAWQHCAWEKAGGRGAAQDVPQAADCFQQAITVARRQQAKSWELRTAMSLSRLWQQQGKRAEAHELLAPTYAWFTEGFDTADLQEA